MLTNGVNHIAIMTRDTDRAHEFYCDVFEATVFADRVERPGFRFSIVNLTPSLQLNFFEIDRYSGADIVEAMFERGRLDHVGIEASTRDSFETLRSRLRARGATDGRVTDYGVAIGMFFHDPDGLELELCLTTPGAAANDLKPPGTAAIGLD